MEETVMANKLQNAVKTINTFIRLGMANEMYEALARVKEEDGIPASEFVRRAIQEKLDRRSPA